MAIDPVALRAFQEEATRQGYSPVQVKKASDYFVSQSGGQQGFIERNFINPVRRGAEALGTAGEMGYEFATNPAVREAAGGLFGTGLFAPKPGTVTEAQRQAASKKILSSSLQKTIGLKPMTEAELKSPLAIAESVGRRTAGTASVVGSFGIPGATTLKGAVGLGATLAGLSSAGEGGKAGEIAKSAALGGVAGAGAYGVGKGVKYVAGKFKGMPSKMSPAMKAKSLETKASIIEPITSGSPGIYDDRLKVVQNLEKAGVKIEGNSAKGVLKQMGVRYKYWISQLNKTFGQLDKQSASLPTELRSAGRIGAAIRNQAQKDVDFFTGSNAQNEALDKIISKLTKSADPLGTIKPSQILKLKLQLGQQLAKAGAWKSGAALSDPMIARKAVWNALDEVINKYGDNASKQLNMMSYLWDAVPGLKKEFGKTMGFALPGIPAWFRSGTLHDIFSGAQGKMAQFYNWTGTKAGQQAQKVAKGVSPTGTAKEASVLLGLPERLKNYVIAVPPMAVSLSMRGIPRASTYGTIGQSSIAASDILKPGAVPSDEDIKNANYIQQRLNEGITPDGLWKWENGGWLPTDLNVAMTVNEDIMRTGGKNLTKIKAAYSLLNPKEANMDQITKRRLMALRGAKAQLQTFGEILDDIGLADNMVTARIAGKLRLLSAVASNRPETTNFEDVRFSTASLFAQAMAEVGMKTEWDIQRALRALPTVTNSEAEMRQKIQFMTKVIEAAENAALTGATINPSTETVPSGSMPYYNPSTNSLPITPGATP